MADSNDRDKGRRRRKRGGGRREREGNTPPSLPSTPPKTPIILAKPPTERVFSDPAIVVIQSKPQDTQRPQMVMLKSREDRSSTSSTGTPNIPSLLAGSETVPQQPYQLQRNPSNPAGPIIIEGSSQSRLAPPPEMTHSIKLVDDSFHWCENAMEVLLDQTDFLVVGVVGLQGTGKSTIMSLLAGNKLQESTRSFVFKPQTKETKENCSHQTTGVNMYVTEERIIFLDTQPALSSSVLDLMINHDKKYSSEYSTAENCIEMQSLQITAFLMTVCNVVLVVQDWFCDLHFLNFLQNAEMLKPPTPGTGHEGTTNHEDHPEYYPHIIFVHNKARREDYSVESYNAAQQTLGKIFEASKLKMTGCASLAKGSLFPGFNENTVTSNFNMFLLPDIDTNSRNDNEEGGIMSLFPEFQPHPPFDHMLKVLRNQLFSMPRQMLTHTTLSEKNWFHYAARTWDAVKKSTLLSEYNRLLL